jgi:hypothetical protein
VPWTFTLADRATGTPLGELRQATPRKWSRGLRSGRAASFTIKTKNSLAGACLSADKVLLKVYDDRDGNQRLRHCGPLIGFQRDVGDNGGSVACNSASPLWRLLTRIVGQAHAGALIGSALSPVDRGEALGQLVDALNVGAAAPWSTQADDTGIRRGAIAASASSFWGPWRYYPASEAWKEITTGLDAPEVDLAPVEPTKDAVGLQIAALNVAAALGKLQPNSIFEHGFGRRNVPNFSDLGDSGIVANRALHLPPGFPDNATQQVLVSTPSIGAASILDRGLHEVIVDAPVTTDPMRQQIVDDHVTVRQQPRRTISFTVARDPDPFSTPLQDRRVPRPFVDYDVGDVVPFRAKELVEVRSVDGTLLRMDRVTTIDALFRVYGMEIEPDDLGGETVTLTLQENV